MSGASTLGVDAVVLAAHYSSYSSQDVWVGTPGSTWATYRAGRYYSTADVETDPTTGEVWVVTALYDVWLDRVAPSGSTIAGVDRRELGSLGGPNAIDLDLDWSSSGPSIAVGIPSADVHVLTQTGEYVDTTSGSGTRLSGHSTAGGVTYAASSASGGDDMVRIEGGVAKPYGRLSNVAAFGRGTLGEGLVLGSYDGVLYADPEGDGTFEQMTLGHVVLGDMHVSGGELWWAGVPDYGGDQPVSLYHAALTLADGVDQNCDGSDG